MKMLYHLSKYKITAMHMLLTVMVCTFSAGISFSFNPDFDKRETFQYLQSQDEQIHTDYYSHSKFISQPVDDKKAAFIIEPEITIEEEDSHEQDNAGAGFPLLYQINLIHHQLFSSTIPSPLQLSGSNPLYILYHSWKIFLA